MSKAINGILTNKKNNAFTLAEILITLAIIGVVAALTVPVVVKNYQKKVLITQLKKTYSTLSAGFRQMIAAEGVNNLSSAFLNYCSGGDSICYEINDILVKYFKMAKNYEYNYQPYSIRYFGETETHQFNPRYFVLSDGAYIITDEYHADEEYFPLHFIVDVNGEKKPNEIGRDIFSFRLHLNGNLEPCNATSFEEGSTTRLNSDCEPGVPKNSVGLRRIIEDGWEMKY